MSRRTGSRRTAAVRRVVPVDVWRDGKLRAFLTEVGLTPDDDRHVFLSNDQIEQRWITEHQAACASAAAATERLPPHLRGAEIKPFYLLHRGLWTGREHFFFNWLQVWPSHYCIQLPTTDAAAAEFGTFRCPDAPDRGHMETAARIIDALAAELRDMSERIRTLDPLQADPSRDPELLICFAETKALKERHAQAIAELAGELRADLAARWAARLETAN